MISAWRDTMISACMIVYNESDLIARALDYLLSVKEVDEICVLDSFSKDGTWQILGDYASRYVGRVVIGQRVFTSFGEQRNFNHAMARGEWILTMDGDETYSRSLGSMLAVECQKPEVFAIRVPTIALWGEGHYIKNGNSDPHIRVWWKAGTSHAGIVHELLTDSKGRVLHGCRDADIVNSWDKYPNVWMKHAQMLKSTHSLMDKGQRWREIGAIEDCCRKGMPINELTWAYFKETVPARYPIVEIPSEWM